MWNKFFGLLKLVIDFGEQTKKNTDRIDALEEDMQNLNDGMTRMAYEIQRLRDEMGHFKDNEANEREKMALRLENTLLKMEKRLAAPKNEENE